MEVYAGHLTVKISGLLKDKVFPNHWCVLHSGKSTLPPIIEIADKKDSLGKKKCIELESCRWSKSESIEPAFSISIKGKLHVFTTQTEEQRLEWVRYLGCLTPELSNKDPIILGDEAFSTVMQANVLYSSSEQVFTFNVVADHNKGRCSALNFNGIYNLVFDSNNILLMRQGTNEKVAVWTYYTIRSFGHSQHTVSFIVGKQSTTGEGLFSFLTTEGEEIIDVMTQQTKRLREGKSSNPTVATQPAIANTAPALNSKDAVSSPGVGSKPPVFPKTKHQPPVSAPQPKPAIAPQRSVKKKPAPLAPCNHNSSSTKRSSIDNNFKTQINQLLAAPSSPVPSTNNNNNNEKPLKPATSMESISSAASRKERKRLKDAEKEMKKREKKEAKEREKKAKEAEKAQKKLLKAQNSSKSKFSEFSNSSQPLSPVDDYTYSEPNDDLIAAVSDGTYADIDAVNVRPSAESVTEGVYDAPWKDMLSPVDTSYPETEYALPQKCNPKHRSNLKKSDTYEEFDANNSNPPQIPSRQGIDEDPTDSDLYDHFNQPAQTAANVENVYGIESASAPFSSSNNANGHQQPSVDSDVYETVQ